MHENFFKKNQTLVRRQGEMWDLRTDAILDLRETLDYLMETTAYRFDQDQFQTRLETFRHKYWAENAQHPNAIIFDVDSQLKLSRTEGKSGHQIVYDWSDAAEGDRKFYHVDRVRIVQEMLLVVDGGFRSFLMEPIEESLEKKLRKHSYREDDVLLLKGEDPNDTRLTEWIKLAKQPYDG